MEKILEKLKGLSIITRHPNRDWHKISAVLLVLAVVSLVWNIYFYFSVRSAVEKSSAINVTSSNPNIGKESEINKTLRIYEEKKTVHDSIKSSPAVRLEDPATS